MVTAVCKQEAFPINKFPLHVLYGYVIMAMVIGRNMLQYVM
jgi:hypothetical protein